MFYSTFHILKRDSILELMYSIYQNKHSLFNAGIPTLIILDKEGKLVTSCGRGAVSSDPDGLVCGVIPVFNPPIPDIVKTAIVYVHYLLSNVPYTFPLHIVD